MHPYGLRSRTETGIPPVTTRLTPLTESGPLGGAEAGSTPMFTASQHTNPPASNKPAASTEPKHPVTPKATRRGKLSVDEHALWTSIMEGNTGPDMLKPWDLVAAAKKQYPEFAKFSSHTLLARVRKHMGASYPPHDTTAEITEKQISDWQDIQRENFKAPRPHPFTHLLPDIYSQPRHSLYRLEALTLRKYLLPFPPEASARMSAATTTMNDDERPALNALFKQHEDGSRQMSPTDYMRQILGAPGHPALHAVTWAQIDKRLRAYRISTFGSASAGRPPKPEYPSVGQSARKAGATSTTTSTTTATATGKATGKAKAKATATSKSTRVEVAPTISRTPLETWTDMQTHNLNGAGFPLHVLHEIIYSDPLHPLYGLSPSWLKEHLLRTPQAQSLGHEATELDSARRMRLRPDALKALHELFATSESERHRRPAVEYYKDIVAQNSPHGAIRPITILSLADHLDAYRHDAFDLRTSAPYQPARRDHDVRMETDAQGPMFTSFENYQFFQ